jgi:hypothetical protein
MIQKLPDLSIHVEVMGCPTTCQHCWAVGRPYQAMPLEDIAWVLHEVRRFCDAHHLTVGGKTPHKHLAGVPSQSRCVSRFCWTICQALRQFAPRWRRCSAQPCHDRWSIFRRRALVSGGAVAASRETCGALRRCTEPAHPWGAHLHSLLVDGVRSPF